MKTLRDSERAAQQQAYMKSSLPFWGITAPQLRKMCKAQFREHPMADKDQWLASVKKIWDMATHREEKHAAIELLSVKSYQRNWLTTTDLPFLQALIADGAWWDFVDPLATNHVGFILRHDPDGATPVMYAWGQDENLWVRRSAILSQLKFKSATDLELLNHCITHSIPDNDFFARKAIGWALREHSKTDAQFVLDYVQKHKEALSGLSKREALKVLIKQGVASQVP